MKNPQLLDQHTHYSGIMDIRYEPTLQCAPTGASPYPLPSQFNHLTQFSVRLHGYKTFL